ncbi:MAG: ABC transporter ATP-binding protein [Bacteroidales bacterium]
MSEIVIKDLHKIYNESQIPVYALNGINVKINAGEFTAITGPSGSGKTTLLNLIGGLDKPSKGSVCIKGTNISEMKSKQLVDFRLHNIGFVFQAYNLIPVLNAVENVAFILELQGVLKEERNAVACKFLEKVGLGDKLYQRPSHLSGGQQQRVAVARALASNPAFVLADEPTANLDSKSTENLLDIMLKLNEELGITFLFSTHDQRVIDRAKRILTIEDGNLIDDKTIV